MLSIKSFYYLALLFFVNTIVYAEEPCFIREEKRVIFGIEADGVRMYLYDAHRLCSTDNKSELKYANQTTQFQSKNVYYQHLNREDSFKEIPILKSIQKHEKVTRHTRKKIISAIEEMKQWLESAYCANCFAKGYHRMMFFVSPELAPNVSKLQPNTIKQLEVSIHHAFEDELFGISFPSILPHINAINTLSGLKNSTPNHLIANALAHHPKPNDWKQWVLNEF